MARKGIKRPIQVFGCTLTDGTQLNAGENGMTTIIVHGDRSITTRDEHNVETDFDGTWVSYIPRTN